MTMAEGQEESKKAIGFGGARMNWMKKLAKEPKKSLFHYTRIDGLVSVFRSIICKRCV
jgi:hypothetical protein